MSNSPWYVRARLKMRQLLLLIALAEEGNTRRAAAALNMTQPAISKLLRGLEAMLDAQLFERIPRGIRPMHYGDALTRHARIVVGSLDQAQEGVLGLKAGHLGHVAVDTIISPGVLLLPPVVAQITREHPGLRVLLEIKSSNVLLERLAQDEFDLVVSRLFAEYDKLHLRYRSLVDGPVAAVAWPGHPLLSEPSLTLADAQAITWVVPLIGSVLCYRLDLMFQRESLTASSSVVEISMLPFPAHILEQSDILVAIGTDVTQYCTLYRMLAILPLPISCQMDDSGITTCTDRSLSPAALHVVQALRDAGRTVYGTGRLLPRKKARNLRTLLCAALTFRPLALRPAA